MDTTHNKPQIECLNSMSINFLELLTIEKEDGTIVPARYIIENGQITGVTDE